MSQVFDDDDSKMFAAADSKVRKIAEQKKKQTETNM